MFQLLCHKALICFQLLGFFKLPQKSFSWLKFSLEALRQSLTESQNSNRPVIHKYWVLCFQQPENEDETKENAAV